MYRTRHMTVNCTAVPVRRYGAQPYCTASQKGGKKDIWDKVAPKWLTLRKKKISIGPLFKSFLQAINRQWIFIFFKRILAQFVSTNNLTGTFFV